MGGMQHYVPRLQGAQEKKLDNDMEEAIVTNAIAATDEDEGASGRRSAFHHRKEDSVDAADDHRMIGSK